MIEKWKRALDENTKVGAIFVGLSKAFDTLNHRLLPAKLKAYDLQPPALKQMGNYLTGRFQRIKVSNSYSSWSEIIAGVRQGSILRPMLFNIFSNDSFLYLEETFSSNYTDDNTLHLIRNTIESVKKPHSNDFKIIENWFHENLMVLNEKKCHGMCFGIGSENDEFIIDGIKLPNSCEEKILGDPNLIHILEVCVKIMKKMQKSFQCKY